jgi:hypothetical protein
MSRYVVNVLQNVVKAGLSPMIKLRASSQAAFD